MSSGQFITDCRLVHLLSTIVIFRSINSRLIFLTPFLTLFWKVPANFRCNLTIRHLINRFHSYDASTEVVAFKTFSQFALCLTGTKDQNRFGITNSRNYRIIINVEMSCKRFLATIVRGHLQCFIGPLKRGIPRTAELLFSLRYYQPGLFPFVRNRHDNSLPMVDPQTNFCSHLFLLCFLAPPYYG
jgi:hypothetical protein